jgi:hypothetical protein
MSLPFLIDDWVCCERDSKADSGLGRIAVSVKRTQLRMRGRM